jgi:hypothetical protein
MIRAPGVSVARWRVLRPCHDQAHFTAEIRHAFGLGDQSMQKLAIITSALLRASMRDPWKPPRVLVRRGYAEGVVWPDEDDISYVKASKFGPQHTKSTYPERQSADQAVGGMSGPGRGASLDCGQEFGGHP